MIAKLVAVATLATVVVAQQNTCTTGPVQCCNSVQKADRGTIEQKLAGSPFSIIDVLIGITDVNALVGLDCSPVSAVGIGGTQCQAQTVCCEKNNFNGLVALGCNPINLNL